MLTTCCVPPLAPLPPLLQFPSDEEAEVELDISDEALAAKNEKVGGCSGLLLGVGCSVYAVVQRGGLSMPACRPACSPTCQPRATPPCPA